MLAVFPFWCCRSFFFSSRRRHTRLTCDWSSDVCSSDLLDIDHARYARLARMIDEDSRHAAIKNNYGGEAGYFKAAVDIYRSEERRVGKECRSRGSAYH